MSIQRPLIARPLAPLIAPLVGGTGLPWESGGGGSPFDLAASLRALLGSKIKALADYHDQVGSPVTAWGDQSPGGTFDYSGGVAPLAGTTINGRAAPDFTANKYLVSAVNASVAIAGGAMEWFSVDYLDTVGADVATGTAYTGRALWAVTTGSPYFVTCTTSGIAFRALDTTYKTSGYATPAAGGVTGQTLISYGRHESGSIYCKTGGGTEVSAACGFTGALTSPLNLGCNYDAAALEDGRKGLLMLTSALTAGERAAALALISIAYGAVA